MFFLYQNSWESQLLSIDVLKRFRESPRDKRLFYKIKEIWIFPYLFLFITLFCCWIQYKKSKILFSLNIFLARFIRVASRVALFLSEIYSLTFLWGKSRKWDINTKFFQTYSFSNMSSDNCPLAISIFLKLSFAFFIFSSLSRR